MPDQAEDRIGEGIAEFSRIASLLHRMGFGESSFGNISLLFKGSLPSGDGREFGLPWEYPDLEGSLLLLTRSGSTMSETADRPEENVGVYAIHGSKAILVRGVGPPSSELLAHLEVHAKLRLPMSAVVHCHVGKMLQVLEGTDPLPGWIRSIPRLRPESKALARATGEAADMDVIIIWSGHGIVAVSGTLSNAFSLIERTASSYR
jgi:ribulose-5-phosphate 4-epimerase/fuculose-1-phosphate aldolase